jgi:intracellular sulfur oxidation DsrE/DsrF family protein
MTNARPSRRSLLSNAATTAAGVAIGSAALGAQAPSRDFQPARHAQDEWLDTVPGKHRTVVDCASVNAAGAGILYANNLYVANTSGYQLKEADIAVVVCLRHFATVFAYNDAMWKKYGQALSDTVQFTDPKTKLAPTTNLLLATDYGQALPNMGITIASVVARGTHFAVCDMATKMISREVATAVKAVPDAVYTELVRNLIPNSHLMAAGVVAINRAQEHGYSLLTAI